MNKILSICIPTYNRSLELDKSLESISRQKFFLKTNDVEIIIYDNCSTDKTSEVVKKYVTEFPSKIFYYRNSTNIGPSRNIENSLKAASGAYRKLSNDTNVWLEGSVEYTCKLLHHFKKEKPVVFFLNESLKTESEILGLKNIDQFLTVVSYISTWIGSFGVWAEDLKNNNDLEKYAETELAHLGLTLNTIESKQLVYIVNKKLFSTQESPWRKRYSLGLVFGRNYLSLLKEHSNSINEETFLKAKELMLKNIIIPYYFNERHDFLFESLEDQLSEYWGEPYYRFAMDSARIKWLDKIKKASLDSLNKLWRLNNKHNYTRLANQCDFTLIKVGKYSYGPLNVYSWGNHNEELSIGNFVSIAEDVKFILGGNHSYKGLMTYPFKVNFCKWPTEAGSKGPVVIGDDVWIGYGAMILSGVSVGQGAVIGAGSVVGKDVPPYAIVVGNPASIVRFRFSEKIIAKLIKINLSNLPVKKFNELGALYEVLNEDNFDAICKKLLLI